jgi:ABC-type multidrug transport system fused ATPase/permease subunit
MLLASWQVGLLVLIAVPLILFITTRLARTLRSRQSQLRTDQGTLTDEAVDIVRGLRVLRGLGGEELFAGRYRAASQRLRSTALGQSRATAMMGASRTLLPGMLLAGVVALAGELVLGGKLGAGQVVAFYGYATYLAIPTNQITFAVQKAMQGHVAAANVIRLLGIKPDIEPAPDSATLPRHGVLADPDSGLRVPAAGLTAVVCAQADAIALADRFGRHVESGVTYAGVPLAELPLAGVRERILVTTAQEHLFAGPLRSGLDPKGRLNGSDEPLWAAIDAAAARDIVEFLPDGLDTDVAAGGREFSGGQQQRLRLVRALMADPEVLILIDPTSAVDANTENQMAEGTARLRDGRGTVVFTTSILLLRRADHVALVLDGTVAAEGSHETLMADERYRALVERRTVAV